MQQKYGTTLWEESDLVEKLEGLGLQEDSGFGGPVYSRYVNMVCKEEGE